MPEGAGGGRCLSEPAGGAGGAGGADGVRAAGLRGRAG